MNNDNFLINEINNSKTTKSVSKAKLLTDDKVLARVTDGIYRQPGSALRELISNAYDADAENVIINTDAPRFESMTIRDDGNGMSIETFVNLINHIGGSAKRNTRGQDLHITSSNDKTVSPLKKRKLIGKIGIGLFSVAQLTRQFEIVTKQKGNHYYLKSLVTLHNYSDESNPNKDNRGESFESGDVEIWLEDTSNIDAHGTDIILHDIKKSAKEILKSLDIWGQTNAETDSDDSEYTSLLNSTKLIEPSFHIGCASGELGFEHFDKKNGYPPSLPWENTDSSEIKFKKLYQAVLDLTKTTVNPKLSINLDNYLNMIWNLSLSVPLDYIDKHPFELSQKEISDSYIISNKHKGQATKLDENSHKFKDYIPFKSKTTPINFNVSIDGIKLFRPLRFTDLPESTSIIKKPIIFFGSYEPNFSGISENDSGGELAFDAYLLWSPKVIPRDHNGVLIRLHNSSGIMFDETFMKHQVAEHTIKSQLSVEIFVTKGLGAALNIDRESFNISHPHYQIIMKWLHQALRQVINKYKQIKREKLSSRKDIIDRQNESKLDQIVNESYTNRGLEPLEKKKLIIESTPTSRSDQDSYFISKNIFSDSIKGKSENSSHGKEVKIKAQALIQLLDSYGLFDNLSEHKQKSLLTDIMNVLGFKGD